jgi:hypothetical protein
MGLFVFILSVELLSAAIKFHPNINGIKIDDSEFLISQYTDDSTLILEDDTLSLNHALEVVELSFTKENILDFVDNMYWRIWQNSKRLNQYRQCQSLDDCNFSNQ